MNSIDIRFVTPAETLPLRHRVLRAGLPVSECHFAGDETETSFHVGRFSDEKLVCIASVMQQPEQRFGLFAGLTAFQLRGMATDPAYRGQYLATSVLQTCVEECRKRHAGVLWCNARIEAVGFYQKQGFLVHPVPFDIPSAGPHQVMHRRIVQ